MTEPETLPDVLTIDEIENLEHQGQITFKLFGEDDRPRNEFVEKVVKVYAKQHKGTIYTQVDSEISPDRVYNKGIHLVNRTGTWAVVITDGVCNY